MSNCPNQYSLLWKLAITAAIGAGLFSLARWYRRPLSTISTSKGGRSESTILTQYLPEAEFAGEVSTVVHAPPEAIFAALHSVTVDDMPIAKWIGELRYLPGKLLGKHKLVAEAQTQPFLQYIQTEGGNLLLAEAPNREIVLGAIGKFHDPADQQVVQLSSPRDFVAFDQPDYQKLAMSFMLSPLDDGSGYRLALIHGTHALSNAARRKFALYWLAIKPGGNFVSWLMLCAVKALAERAISSSDVVMRR
jgi:hypothetical protein